MSRQDLSHRHSQTHRAACIGPVSTRNAPNRLCWSTRLTVTGTRPCCASASGRGQPGANNGKGDTPLIQPSLVIPPPSRGSQYGRNRLLDVAFGGSGGDGDGAGGAGSGGRGNGGAGWGGGGRGGGSGRDSNSDGQGSGSGGFFSGRRFGLLPRVLMIVQFLAWITVFYMLVDTVLNTSSRVARKMWNGARGVRTDGKPQSGTQNPNQSDPNQSDPDQSDPDHVNPEEDATSQSMAAHAKGYGVEEEEGSTEEVVVIEEVVEEVDEPDAIGPSTVNVATPVATDTSATQIAQSSVLASTAQGSSGVVAPISQSEPRAAEAGGGGGADGAATAAAQPASDVSSVRADTVTNSTTSAGGLQGVPVDLPSSLSMSEQTPLEQHQQQEHQAQQLGGSSQARPPFVRYEGARPVEYPTLTIFICILGGVGFFSMLG